jgi:hypothetical protein
MAGRRGVAVPTALAAVLGGGAVLAVVTLGCLAVRPVPEPAITLPEVLPPVPVVFVSEDALIVPVPTGNPS